MKILYVSDLFSGIKSVFFEGKSKPEGSPAFFEPLKYLIAEGNQIDFVFPIFTKENKSESNRPLFLKKSKIHFFNYRNNILIRPYIILKLLVYLTVIIKRGKYDFIYCHGSFGMYGNISANITKTPAGHRIYGSFLYFRLKHHSKFYLALRYYRQYLPFLLPKKFMLMTNDGTKGDKLLKLIGRKNIYKFYFELNGADKIDGDKRQKNVNTDNDMEHNNILLLYPARVDVWKNQEFAIKFLDEMRKIRSIDNINIVFAGSIYNKEYYNYLISLIKDLDLVNNINFCGSISRESLKRLQINSFAVLSFYHYSNLGNVAIEALTSGAFFVTKNDGSFDGIAEHTKELILVKDEKDAAMWISRYLDDRINYARIRDNAFSLSNKIFSSWKVKSSNEYKIIQKAVK